MGQSNCYVPCECDYIANVPLEWDYPMCPGNKTIQCMLASQSALGMGLSNVHWEWDYPMCTGKGNIQCAVGMGLANVPSE